MSKLKISENKLKRIVSESIKKVLNEDELWMVRKIETIKADLDNITNKIEKVKNGDLTKLKVNDFYMLSSGSKDFNNILKYIGQRQEGSRKNF